MPVCSVMDLYSCDKEVVKRIVRQVKNFQHELQEKRRADADREDGEVLQGLQ